MVCRLFIVFEAPKLEVPMDDSFVHFVMKKLYLVASALLAASLAPSLLLAQGTFGVSSPDGSVSVQVAAGTRLQWSVQDRGREIIAPSSIALQLEGGEVLGQDQKVVSSDSVTVDSSFKAINYFKSVVPDNYHQLTLNFKDNYGVIFRVYNDAVAYRFFTKKKGEIIIRNEIADFNFANDDSAFIPYVNDYREGEIFSSSFEALYSNRKISEFRKDSLAFLPVLVRVGHRSVVITEADLENYPGMYVDINGTGKGFKGVFAPYPLESKMGGFQDIDYIPTERADYIAKVNGTGMFPWRVVAIANHDKDLLNNDIVQQLAAPPRIKNISWIKPGQVAWDWWNDWNISHVDFKSGINTRTYKYYIDFASANKIPYIIMDEGWSSPMDLMEVVPAVSLQKIIGYGKKKGVGVILWATWHAVMTQMDTVFPIYAKMGIKGFKIDFIDRDDQVAVASLYTIAKEAAKYHLLVDFHGVFKPTGLQRTYPNVVGNEGVRGMEYMKWSNADAEPEMLTIPYIRMLAGPMDYTPGAMRNATKSAFRPINSMPMCQGTRCQQLAMYVVYMVPLQMLSDNPTAYMTNQECTNFITRVPTTFDQSVPLAGKVGKYVAVARRKGSTWFVGAMTNWTPRDITLDFSFLPEGTYKAVVFQDGVNADRDATDYKKVEMRITSGEKLKIHLAPGGGWAARLEKI